MFLIIETKPFARVGDKFSCKPIFSIKNKSAFIISSGERLLKTLIKRAIMPLVIIASLSAVNSITLFFNSAFNQTLDWQA